MSKAKNKKQPAVKQAASTDIQISSVADADKPDLSKELKVAHYAASVQAWFVTKIEKDKSLLTLASAGVGLLVSFGAVSNTEKILSIFSSLFFIITIFCCIAVFEINAKLIESVIQKKNVKESGRTAKIIDFVLVCSFLLGVVFFALLGIARFMQW